MQKHLLHVIILICCLCIETQAQQISSSCPMISVKAPQKLLIPKEPAEFVAQIAGAEQTQKLTYRWGTNVGEVTGDFGSPVMKLVTNKKDAGMNVVVFVRVEGLPEDCPNTASELTATVPVIIGEPADAFGDLRLNDLKARMDNFFIGMRNNVDSSGLIDIYFSEKETRQRRIVRVQKILSAIKFRKYEITKITFAFMESCGPRETKLWIVPPTADVVEDRPGAIFVRGEELEKNIKKALPRRQCLCCQK